MKKFILMALVAVMSIGTVTAQNKSNLQWSAEVGLGFSTWNGEGNEGVKNKLGYRLGVGLDIPLPQEALGFHTGLSLVSKGVKGDAEVDVETDGGYSYVGMDLTINQLYLEIPALITGRLNTRQNFDVVLGGGLYLAYGIGGKVSAETNGIKVSYDTFGKTSANGESFDGLNRLDIGVDFGVGLDFSKFFVKLELQHGLLKIADDGPRNFDAFLGVGYKF